jgi:nucleoside-diphosphate-sugar epimerase
VDNCAESIRLAGTVPQVDGHAFNIVDDDLPTCRDLLRRYEAEAKRLPGVTVPGWAVTPLSAFCEWSHRWSKGQIPAVLTRYRSKAMWKPLNYSNAKAKTLLGWKPAVDFNDGLRRTFAWVRERGRP